MTRSNRKSSSAATRPRRAETGKARARTRTRTRTNSTAADASVMAASNHSPKSVPAGGPVVALANGYRFMAGEVKLQPQIQSRAILWCRSGLGSVVVNHKTYDLHTGVYLLLPWNRRMTYRAANKQPFHVAAIHWIPMHAINKPVKYSVAHEPDNELADLPWRTDRSIASWRDGVKVGSFDDASALGHLAHYILASYQQHAQQSHLLHNATAAKQQTRQRDQLMRTLAQLLEAQLAHDLRDAPSSGYSSRLQDLLAYMTSHQDQPLDLEHLGCVADCSRATLLRMFKSELRTTPGRWLTECRMNRAMTLLRTTAFPMHVIAQRVGIADAHYFSHVFRKTTGVTPRDYRAQRLAL